MVKNPHYAAQAVSAALAARTPQDVAIALRNYRRRYMAEYGQVFRILSIMLVPLLGIRGAPVLAEVSRWAQGIPQLEPGHEFVRTRAAAIEITAPTVFFIGSYLSGVAMGECLESGMQAGYDAAAAARGLHDLSSQHKHAATAAAPSP